MECPAKLTIINNIYTLKGTHNEHEKPESKLAIIKQEIERSSLSESTETIKKRIIEK